MCLAKASAQRNTHIVDELAVYYLCGFGVQGNLPSPIDILQSLALRKHEIPPISVVAKMALAGEGVKKNEGNALFYLYSINDFSPYLKASKLYKFDKYLKLNDKVLIEWLTQKASDGDFRIQTILGLYCFCLQNFEQSKK